MNTGKKSQIERVLEYFMSHQNEWINGQYFLRTMMISQYHFVIWKLQHERDRYIYPGEIKASPFRDEYGFKSYMLCTVQYDVATAPQSVNEGIPYADRIVDNSAPADDELIPGLRFVQGPLL